MIDQNMTDDEIEAYNVRQRDKREGFIAGARVFMGWVSDRHVARTYPYLKRQGKIVTTNCGLEFRYRGGVMQRRTLDGAWERSGFTPDDIRKLAALLDNPSTIIEDSAV